jgi:hypothetical protein
MRKFKQDFTIANVEWPILGADFLSRYYLKVDLRNVVVISKEETIRSFRRRKVTTITIIESDEEEPPRKYLIKISPK